MNKNIWEKDEYYKVIKDTHSEQDVNKDAVFYRFIKILEGVAGKSILDVGCGEGWFIEKLSKKIADSCLFTGIDVSITGLKRADERKINNAKFLDYNGESFPFLSEVFDISLSSFVFEHLSNPIDTFNEMSRVTKKNGLIIIVCPNFGSPLFKSPCNKENRILLMIKRFIKEFMPKIFFKDNFNWNKVTPIELPDDIHISDYDTLCEPSLSSFQKFLANHQDKYSIIEIDSLWDSYDYPQISAASKLNFFKKCLVSFAKFLGMKKILRFQYFGSFFFVAIKKI